MQGGTPVASGPRCKPARNWHAPLVHEYAESGSPYLAPFAEESGRHDLPRVHVVLCLAWGGDDRRSGASPAIPLTSLAGLPEMMDTRLGQLVALTRNNGRGGANRSCYYMNC